MKIIVASKNPVKINAALNGFKQMFPDENFEVEGVSVPSGVSDQPTSDKETLQGAHTRVLNASTHISGDFWIGMEGGVEYIDEEMHAFAWIVIRDSNGKVGKGKTGTFILPSKISELIRQGMELGDADDIVFGMSNSKQKNGAIGILTNDLIGRAELYDRAVVLALIPFRNKHLY